MEDAREMEAGAGKREVVTVNLKLPQAGMLVYRVQRWKHKAHDHQHRESGAGPRLPALSIPRLRE